MFRKLGKRDRARRTLNFHRKCGLFFEIKAFIPKILKKLFCNYAKIEALTYKFPQEKNAPIRNQLFKNNNQVKLIFWMMNQFF